MDHSNDVLIERLERLERSNRRLKRLGFVVFVAIGTVGAAQGIPHTFGVLNAKQVNTEGISIVDANGKLRVLIGADPATDQGGMTVYQRNGIARVELGTAPQGSTGGLTVFEGDGVQRVGVGISPDGSTAGFAAYDTLGSTRVAAINGADNTGLIGTFQPNGPLGTYMYMVPGADGFNGLFVNQPNGAQRGNILSSSNESFMQLLSPSGATAVGMSEPAGGLVPEFHIVDLNLTTRVTIAASDPSTGSPFEVMNIFGPDGMARTRMDSGITSNNGRVVTFDAVGAQTGLLGGP